MIFISVLILLILSVFITYKIAVRQFKSHATNAVSTLHITTNANRSNYFAAYVAIWSFFPAILLFIITNYFSTDIAKHMVITPQLKGLTIFQKEIISDQILQLSHSKKTINDLPETSFFSKEKKLSTTTKYVNYLIVAKTISIISTFIIFSLSSIILINCNKSKNINFQKRNEKFIRSILLLLTFIAIFTTLAIVCSLFFEAIKFFKDVSILRFLFGIKWSPEDYNYDLDNSFGILPLLSGTFLITFIAVAVAVIIGVSSAIYMAEYMPRRVRKMIKPLLEILSGIPSIVYGFFAALTFSPFIVNIFQKTFGISVSSENALTAGLVMGVMIIPFLSSIADDVFNSIPNNIREGAIGMGSMKSEMILKILLPAAIPGIVGGILLAISRAIGETMIVVMASSLAANLTFDPLQPVTTITTQIVLLVQGDQEFNSPKTLAAFALGFTLLVITLVINIIAIKIVNKFRRVYN